MTFVLTFNDVGRDKATFSAEVERLEHRDLRTAIGKRLASRDVDFEIDEELRVGSVFVGGCRKVGEFMYEVKP